MRIHLTLRTAATLLAVTTSLHASMAAAAPGNGKAGKSAQEAGASGERGDKPNHHGAQHHLDVSPALQAKIKAAHESVSKGAQPGVETQRAFAAELAAEVRANKLDDAALDARLASLKARASEAGARQAAFLKALHASLTPAERQEFAAATRADADRIASKQARAQGSKPGDKDSAEAPPAEGGPAAEHMQRKHGRPGALVKSLQLTPDQANKLKTALDADRNDMRQTHEAMRAAHLTRTRALADSFANADFDPAKLPSVAVPSNGGPAAHELKVVRALLPVLTDTQREALAAELGKDRHGHRHHGRKHARSH